METQLNPETIKKKVKLNLQVKNLTIKNTISIQGIQVGLNLPPHLY